jgi:hypothetical protein
MVRPPHRLLTCPLEYHNFEQLAIGKQGSTALYGGQITIPVVFPREVPRTWDYSQDNLTLICQALLQEW